MGPELLSKGSNWYPHRATGNLVTKELTVGLMKSVKKVNSLGDVCWGLLVGYLWFYQYCESVKHKLNLSTFNLAAVDNQGHMVGKLILRFLEFSIGGKFKLEFLNL